MSMMTVPSLAPGARTLPGELRVPYGNAYGWHRLHQNLAPLTEPPTLIPVDPRISLSGLGDCAIDPTTGMLEDITTGAACMDTTGYVDPSTFDVSQIPTESPYPVVITTANADGSTSSQSMTPAQLTALINADSNSLSRILAITQGGSVLANGSIIGSSQASALAAQQSALNISTAGLTGIMSNPIILLGGLALAVVLMSRK